MELLCKSGRKFVYLTMRWAVTPCLINRYPVMSNEQKGSSRIRKSFLIHSAYNSTFQSQLSIFACAMLEPNV